MKNNEVHTLMYINQISKLFFDYLRKETGKEGIPLCYRPIIKALANENNLTQLELTKRTLLKAPTVSLTLQKMEQDGYIKKEVDESDARIYHIVLLDKGFKFNEEVHKMIEVIENNLINNLGSDKIANVEVLLLEIRNVLTQMVGIEL